jgi:hypothetical protein
MDCFVYMIGINKEDYKLLCCRWNWLFWLHPIPLGPILPQYLPATQKKERLRAMERRHYYCVSLQGGGRGGLKLAPSNIIKASICHTERRNSKSIGRVLACRGREDGGYGGKSKNSKKSWLSSL